MTGQQGTPEESVKLPIATYGYGSVVDPATNKITYEKALTVQPRSPSAIFTRGIGYTSQNPSPEPHGPNDLLLDLTTDQGFVDLNGDGRPDFYDGSGISHGIASSFDHTSSFTYSPRATPVDIREKIHSTIPNGVANPSGSAGGTTINDTLRTVIDMNGDGRLDVVETDPSDIDHWTIHLNTPDPADPKNIIWVDVKVPVAQMRAALNTTGQSFGRVPMTRNTTTPKTYAHCWFWEGVNGRWQKDSLAGCGDIPADSTLPKTITEFELKDVNGDGYPDFVFNASYVNSTDPVAKPPIPANPVNLQRASTLVVPDMTGSRDVKVLINTAGAHLADGVNLFTAVAIPLEVGGTSGSGVARWEPAPGASASDTSAPINQTCGLEDVNGDGIVDRVTSSVQSGSLVTTAALGTGDLSQPYSMSATITLPGPLGRTETAISIGSGGGIFAQCGGFTQSAFLDTHRTRGLRDINGDGIPDYVSGSLNGASATWTVALGTGVGFTAPVQVAGDVGLELSLERTDCLHDGTRSTPIGLYDIDGDGQPEIINLVVNSTDVQLSNWDVYQLKRFSQQTDVGSTASIPEAGRLTTIDNGYGAVTQIGYKSAKEDTQTLHRVSYPEIVTTAVATTNVSVGRLLETARYAYGNISQYFDASADRFVSSGYQRSIQLGGTVDDTPNAGMAEITDTYGPQPFDSATDNTLRNYLMVGSVRDVTTLSNSNLGTDPWALLGANITADTRRIAGAHQIWAARSLPQLQAGE